MRAETGEVTLRRTPSIDAGMLIVSGKIASGDKRKKLYIDGILRYICTALFPYLQRYGPSAVRFRLRTEEQHMMIRRFSLALILSVSALLAVSLTADEGMYPLSDISRLDLKSKGLEIDIKEIYNPDGVSLVDAICQVGGGTGEFVSNDGLILTNHHIAFSGVADASTPEKDYLRDGFTARTRAEELPAKGYICRITEAYRDVSGEVLRVVTADMAPDKRSDAIISQMRDLAKKEEAGRENISCEVSEMFPGKSYVLFTYRIIKDVRMVYVPPQSIGNYGGETDNWIWPRHTGDFSFLRAYVAPDGKTAEYSKDNIPFKPKRFIKVAPKGVSEGDFVFILGYPGRTYRHKTSHYIGLWEKTILPFLSKRYDYMIETMESASRNDRALQLRFADNIKGLANATKNYKGKIQGLRRLGLVNKRIAEEAELQRFVNADKSLKGKYGNTLAQIAQVYTDYERFARQELTLTMLGRNEYMAMLTAVVRLLESEPDAEKRDRMRDAIQKHYGDIHRGTESHFLATLILQLNALPADQRPGAAAEFSKTGSETDDAAIERIRKAFDGSTVGDMHKLLALVDLNMGAITTSKDPFIALARDVAAINEDIVKRRRVRDGELKRLEAEYIDAKMAWQQKDFIPDANSTLRLTYGYIRGYAPADATYHSPQTTLRGLIDKYTGEEPFDLPPQLIALFNNKNYDKSLEDELLKDVPVAMLYNMDTTGGNSGSPVLNARGELVGVNFDRAFEATVNDYQWSEDYSRSIGADIRYVLFVAKYLGGADFLLKELGVN
jgi:hypothetical protein